MKPRAHRAAVPVPVVVLVLMLVLGCTENRTHLSADAGAPADIFECFPNLDGRIDAHELLAATDLEATYLVGADRTVDLGGPPWDWSEDAGDEKQSFTAARLTDQWYAPVFPDGEFVVPLDDDTDAIYAQDDAALWLLGIASVAPDQTLLPYTEPVPVYPFPIEVGDSYAVVGNVAAGTLDRLPYVGADTYVIEVDAAGEMILPHLRFTDAYRVRTTVTVAPAVGGVTVTRRQVSFLFECFGEVARATSRNDEPSEQFTLAAEIRRFSL